jgi:2-polyprenyl-3-methyl-5-hydroxy-6-metoxy-1,4-benzoquinol methylase
MLLAQQNLNSTQDQLDWVSRHGVKFSSALDFGAGDCSGAYLMARKCGSDNVFAVDSSRQTNVIANSMGLICSTSLDTLERVEFVNASHTIEHVADLIHTFNQLDNSVCDGGYVFIETPNVADKKVLRSLVMTRHTFMLSEALMIEQTQHT